MTQANWTTLFNAIMDNIGIPILVVLGAALVFVLKNKFDKIAKSVVARNEINDMEKKSNIRRDLIKMVDESVEAAVVANMQLADQLKESGEPLTQEQATSLNNNAKTLVINSLPPSLTESDGVLLELIGGQQRLDSMISTMIEKHVYDYKLMKLQLKQNEPVVEVPEIKAEESKIMPVRASKRNKA